MAGLIDVGILKPELAGSFAAGYRGAEKARQEAEQARQQSERTQQQIAQGRQKMQMDEFTLQKLREDRAALTDLQAKLRSAGQSDDPKLFFQTLINTGNPDYMNKGYEGLQRYKELQQADQVLRQFAPEMFVNAATPAKPITALAPGALGSGTFGVMPEPINALAPKATETPQPTNAMVAAPVADNAPDVNALRRQLFMLSSVNDPRAKAMADVIKGQITEASKPYVVGGRLVTGAGKELYTAPEKASAPPAMVAEYTFAKTPEGGGYVGSFEKFVRDRAIAARPPGAPRQEAAPVAVVDPATGKQIFVSREEALRNRMTPASAMENLAPKEIQKREAALPQATSAVQGFESKSDKFIADLMALRDHPGLSSITGIAAGRMPGLTSEGRAAQALYDKVVAKGGFQALQDLRDASKTGGALGNVSNQEGKQLTASFAAIDRRQDAPDVKAAIDQAIADIQGSKTRMREAYDVTYSYKSGATPAIPPAVVPDKAGGPAMPAKPGANLTPAEQAELEQLRQRFRK